MRDYFRMFAQYNRWSNARLYQAAAQLPDAEYRKERGAFFGSLHGTLNHLVVTDRVWLDRFEGRSPGPTPFDLILEESLSTLKTLREAEDTRIAALVDGFAQAQFAAPFAYKTMGGTPMLQPLQTALAHFFNHQTHHRGQVHCMLTQAGVKPADTDLPMMPG